jgi:hypothetical protein
MSETDSELGFAETRPRNPFRDGQEVAVRPAAALGALASAEQQRALGELQAQIMLARMNPRDPQQAVDNVLRDCSRITLAQVAEYEYARGGTDIKGPSIKLMEAIARRWGNIHSGFKIVHTEGNTSDVMTYAWDVETGYRDERQFQVRHIRDTRNGPVKVTDERDIYELIANSSQRRKRACLQAVIPSDVVEAAVEQCRETMSANVDTSVEGLKTLLKAFAEFQVTQAQIEQRIQCKLEAISPGQVMQLSRIYTSLKDGISVPSHWFRAVDPPRPTRQPQKPTQAAISSQNPASTQLETPKTEEKQLKAEEKQAETPQKPENPASVGISQTSQEISQTSQVENDPEADAETDATFEHVVFDETGAPIDGEVHLDPLAWATTFMALWHDTPEESRDVLIQQNLDALHEASTLSPEADVVLDPISPGEAEEPEVDPEEKVSSAILQELPRLGTAAQVIAFSKSPTVMAPIQRWQNAGRTGLVTSVKAAFSARLARLKAGDA